MSCVYFMCLCALHVCCAVCICAVHLGERLALLVCHMKAYQDVCKPCQSGNTCTYVPFYHVVQQGL